MRVRESLSRSKRTRPRALGKRRRAAAQRAGSVGCVSLAVFRARGALRKFHRAIVIRRDARAIPRLPVLADHRRSNRREGPSGMAGPSITHSQRVPTFVPRTLLPRRLLSE